MSLVPRTSSILVLVETSGLRHSSRDDKGEDKLRLSASNRAIGSTTATRECLSAGLLWEEAILPLIQIYKTYLPQH